MNPYQAIDQIALSSYLSNLSDLHLVVAATSELESEMRQSKCRVLPLHYIAIQVAWCLNVNPAQPLGVEPHI